MLALYRKKPVIITAVRYVTAEGLDEIAQFVGDDLKTNTFGAPYIDTLEGEMLVKDGDWIIRGVHGEYYPCKDDIFHKTYEWVEDVTA